MPDDDYELLPHKDIIELKSQLENLKKGPNPEAQESMEKLTESIDNLLNLFKQAASQMHLEDQEAGLVEQKLIPLHNKLDRILDQHNKIAEGIVALADMVKDLKDAVRQPIRMPPTMLRPMPRPMMPPMPPMGPPLRR